MALQKDYTDDRGFNAPKAYWRVFKVNADWASKKAHVIVSIHLDQNSRDQGKTAMDGFQFTITESNGFAEVFDIIVLSSLNNNPVRAVYGWLKQQPELQGAIDV